MSYQIADQPTESSLRAYVVRPSMPLLAAMLAGAWLAWPWFAFNAIAMGSPTRKRELGLCAAAFAITGALALILIALVRREIIPVEGMPLRFALLAIVTFKLGISYYLATIQGRTFAIYEYYGGPIRDANRVLGAGRILRFVVINLIDHPLWIIIVASGAAAGLWHGTWGGLLGELVAGWVQR
ncbi:MAG TPA: hypothetical protein VGC42_23295 [Kofleriaceae bacterium]